MLSKIQRPVKYVISGGLAATVHLSILYALTEYADIWYILASVIAFLCAFCVGFSLQKFWTFSEKSLDCMPDQLKGYLFVVSAGLIINSTLLYFLVEFLGVWYMASQFLVSGTIAIFSFFFYRIIFRQVATEVENF